MECLPVDKIPEGDNWTYELKLDGYRLEAVKRETGWCSIHGAATI